MRILSDFTAALLDAIAPPLCVLCRDEPGALPWLCDDCAVDLVLERGARCLRCGVPRRLESPTCAECIDFPRAFAALRTAAPHRGVARRLVHRLKYQRVLAAAAPLGHLAAAAARMLPIPAGAVVVPVPLHPRRRRQRGFNQSAEIGRVVAAELGMRHRPRLLRRIRDLGPSVDRTAAGRRRVVRGAFRARFCDDPILLVDDVVSTGSTLASCARALQRRGAKEIWAVAVTRS
ncbi:MAG: ComF family protein [Planctomycetota bacterium]